MTKKKHYVNNKQFHLEMVKYIDECRKAEENEQPYPRVPESIGSSILDICTRRVFSPSFIKFPVLRDDMISDAIENCLKYIRNYNYEKYQNPFAYFTQIANYAYIRRIVKEKKQFQRKVKYVQSMSLNDEIMNNMTDEEKGFVDDGNTQYFKYLQSLLEYEIEEKPKPTKENTSGTLGEFVD